MLVAETLLRNFHTIIADGIGRYQLKRDIKEAGAATALAALCLWKDNKLLRP